MKKFLLILIISSVTIGSGKAGIYHNNISRKAQTDLSGISEGNYNDPKVKEPRKVIRAKRKQEANDRKLKREYADLNKKSQKRSIDIQTPEVQARMKQNRKDSAAKDKAKKKNIRRTTRSAGKKYN
jgi:hypothetical protein